ncbi:hypothetical protein [Mesorhizobium sp. Root157]|uniref:hypothetical protein n=1 Tax=Mesorhizobium sp. Root157 TaxID=1736477 RepID=UPI0012E34A00|nr:hypothetical protein [Mesorhizobium sp. Root157]
MDNLPFPDMHDWMEKHSAEVAAGMSAMPPVEAVSNRIGDLMGQACNGDVHTQASMLEYVATAHGLHQASALVRAEGRESWANDLFGVAQLFLHYAVDDIAAMAVMTRACAPNPSGLNAVH